MTDSPDPAVGAQSAAPIHPKLNAEQALTRLLELIRSSRSSEEFTPDRLNEIMGVPIKMFSPGYYGFGEQVSKDWWYGIERRERPRTAAPFSFSFNEAPGTFPDMADICQLDFDMFSDALVSMGFTKTPYYVEHGRLMNYIYDRMRDGILEMRIEVYPEGEHIWNEKTGSGRVCAKMIEIY